MNPIILTELVLLVVAAGGLITGTLLHKWFERRAEESSRYTAELPRMTDTIAFISVAVGILLGLLLSISVTNFQDAQTSIKEFGTSVINSYRATESFEPAQRDVVRTDLDCATETFIENDWLGTQISEGDQTNLWLNKLNTDISNLTLDNTTQSQILPVLVQSTFDMGHWRQLILLSSMQTIPPIIWVVIYASVFLLGMLLTMHLADRRGLARMSFAVAYIAIALIIVALCVLDYPLDNLGLGPVIRPDSLVEMLKAADFSFVTDTTKSCPVLVPTVAG